MYLFVRSPSLSRLVTIFLLYPESDEIQLRDSRGVERKMSEEGSCQTCYGYGMWAIGLEAPMGPMDGGAPGGGGMPTKPCPECGANLNPIIEAEIIEE